ncbi:hypothetical protein NDU88_009523 [Pleurodeles waltl]|uniref:Uncharacterized protein n=1 Tax=Pleurodeles waltl TaxID=8319 RepID=A0AAV7PVG1_PLEWA|nr:hypothetical protein NDU88_009523 [Pleurodeles waltl]
MTAISCSVSIPCRCSEPGREPLALRFQTCGIPRVAAPFLSLGRVPRSKTTVSAVRSRVRQASRCFVAPFAYVNFPLMREVGARLLLVPLLCKGRRPRRTSTTGGARPRAGPGALLLPCLGGGVWSQCRRTFTSAVGPEPRSVSVSAVCARPCFVRPHGALVCWRRSQLMARDGAHPGRGLQTPAHLCTGRLSLQWAAAALSLKPALFLKVLGWEVGACLVKNWRHRRQDN